MIWLTGVLFIVFMLMGMPVGFVIALSSLAYFFTSDFLPLGIAFQKFAAPTQSFPMIAVPLFILVGNLLTRTGITERLLDFARLLTGWMIGGLAQINVLLAMLMGGVAGSAVADASMQSRMLGFSMIERGYPRAYTAVVIAFASLITATLPPSILLILFGFVGNVSIGKLFLAGIIPGFLLTITLMITNYIMARRMKIQPETLSKPTFKEVMVSFRRGFWALMFPVILIVVIRLGLFTTSEAGAFIVLYAIIIGGLVYKELTWQGMLDTLTETLSDLGIVMLLVMAAFILGHISVLDQLPQAMTEFITEFTESPTGIMLLIFALVLVVGMVLDASPLVLLLTPILLPIVTEIGYDPIHFGIMFITLTLLGANTPPVGICMYTVCGILKCDTVHFMKASVPYLLAFIIFVAILFVFPQTVMFLPNLLMP